MMTPPQIVVEASHLIKDYEKHRALDDVSLRVEKGKIHGLLGPNGAGKTTLIRILNQITAPDQGTISFNGHPFTRADLNNIGYLPEERGLYPKMKVGEQAIYLAQLKGLSRKEAKARLEEWFTRFDILQWWNKTIRELSKGMAQKVQFICTVIHKPDLLIFDEPFSGFDPLNVDLLKREIIRLKEEGHTLIFSTHNMQSVEDLCDNLTLINKSHVVLDGSVEQIREEHKGNLFEVTYDALIPTPPDLEEMYQINTREVSDAGKTTYQIANINNKPIPEIVADWNSKGNMVRFQEILPSMNDIFLDVVRLTASPDNKDSNA